MNELESPLQLNPLVTVRPVADYPLSVQERLSGAEDDYIVSERRSRFSAIRISATTAEMLKRFDRPKLVGEAVCELAARLDAEPRDLLAEAFAALLELRGARVLVTDGERAQETLQPRETRLAVGDRLAGYEVVRILDTATETEIYELAAPAGKSAALKLVPAAAPDFVKRAAKRECVVLAWLAKRGLTDAPRLLDETRDEESHRLFLEWQAGRTLNHAARDPELGLKQRLGVARALIGAYGRLNAVGVLHGDVHGGNVMVDEQGSVRLIDFGAALVDGLDPPDRIGLLEEHEPEGAAELLAGRVLPGVTPRGEQYAVAGLLTLALTGRPALMLPLEEQRALEEIVRQAPRAWDMAGHRHLASLEDVIARALSKDPADRFASMADFAAAALAEIDRALPLVAAAAPAGPGASPGLRDASRAPRRALHAQWGLGGKLIESGLPHQPNCSIYYGAAGIALGLLRASVVAEDGALLAASQVWMRKALAGIGTEGAFEGKQLGVFPERIGRLSVLNNEVGLYYVASLIAHAVGDDAERARMIDAFSAQLDRELATAATQKSFSLDLAGGLPGLLLASLQLSALSPPGAGPAPTAQAMALRERLLDAVADCCAKPAFDGAYLGLAHGLAGALYALLDSDARLALPSDARLRQALQVLAGQAVETAEGTGWPTQLQAGASLGWSGWCHGSAGYIPLWLAAARGADERRYLALAEGAAEFAWKQRSQCGCSLCCGGAGLALSYEKLAARSGDSAWRRRAEALMFDERPDSRDLCAPASLFRGQLGVELVRLELGAGGAASFPLMDSPLDI